MDVPYDPACPLSIDSDDQSFENDEEIEQRVRDKLLEITPKDPKFSKKANGEQKSLPMWRSISSQSEKKFVPAFEDDDTELLDYCLRESGFLSDDNFDLTSKKDDNLAKDEKVSPDMDNQESMDASLAKEDELETHEHKKKRKKHKDEHKSRKDESKSRHKSSKDREKRKHDSDRGRQRSKEKKNGDKSEKKSDKKSRKRLNKSTSSFNDTMDADSSSLSLIDGVDIFTSQLENEDIFPLSKAEDTLNHSHEKKPKKDAKEGKGLVKTRKEGKARHRSKDIKDKEKKKAMPDKDRKPSKAKRKRSKSRHRRSSSSDSEPQRKKKKRSKDKSKERSDKDRKHEKSKNDTKHEKKKKEVSNLEKSEEKSKRHKKKRKHSDRKSGSQNKDNNKKVSVSEDSPHRKKLKESADDKSKIATDVKKPRVVVEVKKHDESKSKSSTHKEHRKHDKEHSKENIKEHNKEHKDHKRRDRKESESKSEKRQSHSKSDHVSEKKKDPEVVESNQPADGETSKEEKIKRSEDVLRSTVHVVDNKGLLGLDTDSEFERLSDIEREIEQEKSMEESATPVKQEDAVGVKEEGELVEEISEAASEIKLQSDSSKLDAHIDDNQGAEERGDDDLLLVDSALEKVAIDSDSKEGQSGTNTEKLVSPMECSSMLPSGEKRIFKLFSKEETQKLQMELLSKDEGTTMDITEEVVNEIAAKGKMDAEPEITLSESMEKKVIEATEITVAEMVKENVSVVEDNDLNEIPVKMPVENEASMEVLLPNEEDIVVEKEVEVVEKKRERKSGKKSKRESKKSKDDLFDDIFSKEDKGTKDTDGLAEMLGDDDTSPKRSSHRKHHHHSGSGSTRKSLKEDLDAKKEPESLIKKAPKLNMENGKYEGKKSKSPEETIIPGLEPVVSIPGLESPLKDEITEVDREISESKIPLLFDDELSPEKTGVPKTPELSPEEELELKKKQPYTPPEEFTGEPENNQFDSYYHLEADDSPYNPEDLMPMDMDLSPVDASNIQQDALKGAVQMRLKEPFSGFENPTWEKIIKAKSKHELKRQKRKSHQEKGRSHEHKHSSRQQKTVDMLVRQSRVEQECKEVLKLYYKSKEITKEEYKAILRKAVPQVTMSNRPIIPEKIRSLMKKFVGKCKGQRFTEPKQEPKRRKPVRLSPPSFSQGLTFPGEQRFRYLNPNLPMPPM